MGYPHWLIVAGAIVLVLGFIWLAHRQRKGEAKLKEWRMGNEQLRSQREAGTRSETAEGEACGADEGQTVGLNKCCPRRHAPASTARLVASARQWPPLTQRVANE